MGLSVLSTKASYNPDVSLSRYGSMRRGVLFTARAIEESISGREYRKAFITLTYRPDVSWSPNHIKALVNCYYFWAKRHGFKLLYVWVMELHKSGVPHYHLLLWLPVGFTPPLPDKQGWWRHGMTNAKWVRSPLGYLVKYLSKGSGGLKYPSNARIWGSGGLSAYQRMSRAWYRCPEWLKNFSPKNEICQVKRWRGGWWNITTACWYRSPWWYVELNSKGPIFQWVGWKEDDIVLFDNSAILNMSI